MAALVEGQQYGLSSHDNNSVNKTLIFLKLTDSALKSIEEYIQNKSNCILKPSIKFQSNNGVICLPIAEDHSKSYGFTLSNVETDGPQGSFECLQQSRSRSLESLGCMLWKMHISANEDSYESTKVKMAAVEKENKKFCTKEIKPSGSHVGRKIKVKRPLSSIPSKPSSPPLHAASASKVAPKLYPNAASTLSNDSSASGLSYSSNNSSASIPIASTSTAGAAGISERHIPTPRTVKNPELLKMSCRERIIHLLALRPYKKPELLAKLLSEGIKDKEKRGISAILSQVAICKGNSYTLANHAWNEVQESWKFYSREEAETVRTRKRESQNAQENGRSTQSPEQSPPLQQKRVIEAPELSYLDQRSKKQRISHCKRDNAPNGLETMRSTRDGESEPHTEKSGFSDKKLDNRMNESRTNGFTSHDNLNQRYNSNSNPLLCRTDRNEFDSNNNLSPNQTSQAYVKANMLNGHAKTEAHSYSGQGQKYLSSFDRESKKPPASFRNRDASKISGKYSSSSNGKYVNTEANGDSNYNQMAEQVPGWVDSSQANEKAAWVDPTPARESVPECVNPSQANEKTQGWTDSTLTNGWADSPPTGERAMDWDDSPDRNGRTPEWDDSPQSGLPMINSGSPVAFSPEKPTSNGHYHNGLSTSNSAVPDSELSVNSDNDSQDSFDSIGFDFVIPTIPLNCDYLNDYVKVTTQDQRNSYKAAFNAEYDEYKALYDKVFQIVRKFLTLEHKLNNCTSGSKEYFSIKEEIHEEYLISQSDPSYEIEKNKLAYMHAKLSYIKKLVTEYDAQVTGNVE